MVQKTDGFFYVPCRFSGKLNKLPVELLAMFPSLGVDNLIVAFFRRAAVVMKAQRNLAIVFSKSIEKPAANPNAIQEQSAIGGVMDIRLNRRSIYADLPAFFYLPSYGIFDDELVDLFQGFGPELLDIFLQGGGHRNLIVIKSAEIAESLGVIDPIVEAFVAEPFDLLDKGTPQNLLCRHTLCTGSGFKTLIKVLCNEFAHDRIGLEDLFEFPPDFGLFASGSSKPETSLIVRNRAHFRSSSSVLIGFARPGLLSNPEENIGWKCAFSLTNLNLEFPDGN
jgi:hypothetical protein